MIIVVLNNLPVLARLNNTNSVKWINIIWYIDLIMMLLLMMMMMTMTFQSFTLQNFQFLVGRINKVQLLNRPLNQTQYKDLLIMHIISLSLFWGVTTFSQSTQFYMWDLTSSPEFYCSWGHIWLAEVGYKWLNQKYFSPGIGI